MRFEIERLKNGWADIRFHLDNPARLCKILKYGTISEPDVEVKSLRFTISFWDTYGSPRFFFEFLKALNEISFVESGSRYVRFDSEGGSDGALRVRKRNPYSYEVTVGEYWPHFGHRLEPGVIFDSNTTGGDAEVLVISDDMQLDYIVHAEFHNDWTFTGNRASRYLRERPPSFGEILPDEAVIVDERGLVLGRRCGFSNFVQNTLTEAEFLGFMLSVEAAFGKYATVDGLEYFIDEWTVGPDYGNDIERIFPCGEFAKLKKRLRSKGLPEPQIPDFIEEKTPELFEAIRNNESPDVLRGLIEAIADVNAKGDLHGNEETALEIALRFHRNPEILRMLLEAGADVNAKNNIGETALMMAVGSRWDDYDTKSEIIRVLLEAGADVNATYNDGRTALMCAISNTNPAIIRALIQAGADVNAKDEDGETALMKAASYNENPEILRVLLDAGADINIKNGLGRGETAVLKAARSNKNPEIIRVLIEAGADVNARADFLGRTALMLTAENNTRASDDKNLVMRILIEAGADVNARDNDGRTALMWVARYNENPEILRILIEAGADVNARDNGGKTVLMETARYNINPEILRYLEILRYFIEIGVDVNAKDKNGKTALMEAARDNNKPDILRTLIEAGADVNASDNDGRTALMAAVYENEKSEILHTLVQAGADINVKNKGGKTVLMEIASFWNENPEALRALFSTSADIDAKGDLERVRLQESENLGKLRVLIEAGANVNAQDDNGKTALAIAAEHCKYIEIRAFNKR